MNIRRFCLCLALLAALCLAACAPAAPDGGETNPSTTVPGESSGAPLPSGSGNDGVPADPTDPVDSTDPSDSTEPTDPGEVTEPTQGTEPADPTEPVDPTDPANPTDPQPTDPVTPPVAETGSKENPAALTIGSNSAKVTGKGGYYYTWTATKDATLELQISSRSWAYEVYNLTAGDALTQSSNSGDDLPTNPARIPVLKGDTLLIMMNTAKGTAGTVSFKATVSDVLVGTEAIPYLVKTESVTGIRVLPGQTVLLNGRVYGTTMVISGAANAKLVFQDTEYTPGGDSIRVAIPEAQAGHSEMLTFALTNCSGSIQIYTVSFEIPVGTLNNPDKLTMGSHTVSVTADGSGYVYQWTASADGVLTLQMEGSNWYYQLYNLDSYKVSEGNSTDSGENPGTIEVKAGQVVKITINSGNGKAASVTFTASLK